MICNLLKVKKWSVKNLCERYGMQPVQPAHRAESDDVATEWMLYNRIIHEAHPTENVVEFIMNFYLEKDPVTINTATSRGEQESSVIDGGIIQQTTLEEQNAQKHC